MKQLAALWLGLCLLSLPSFLQAQRGKAPATVTYDEALYEGMQWRLVGPFRGGRAGTATGVPGKAIRDESYQASRQQSFRLCQDP